MERRTGIDWHSTEDGDGKDAQQVGVIKDRDGQTTNE